jgi:hypothetical protein
LEKTIRNLAYPEMIESQRNSEVSRRAILQRIDWSAARSRELPENVTREEVVAKARDLMAPVLGMAPTTGLIEKTLSLEKVKNIVELRPFLQRA